MTVEGELDDISGSGQTKAAHALCKGVERREGDHLEVKGAGHYGIFSGRRWRTVVYPQVKAFIADYHAKAVAKASEPASVAASPSQVARAQQRAADALGQLRLDDLGDVAPDLAKAPAPQRTPVKRAAAKKVAAPRGKAAAAPARLAAKAPVSAAAKRAAPGARATTPRGNGRARQS